MKSEFPQESWSQALKSDHPFVNPSFHTSLQDSLALGKAAGWMPVYFETSDAVLYTYLKTHSYGEYIFDWSWAHAYHQHQLPYYPKLTSMVPFTPVTTPHFIMPEFSESKADILLNACEDFYLQHGIQGSHFLFITPEEKKYLASRNYLIRESVQYHFFNHGYADFSDFLSQLKSRKAKNIAKERSFPLLEIRRYTGEELSERHADNMYRFYLSTIEGKDSTAYLNASFFRLVFSRMKSSILYIEATKAGKAVAGSLFFYSSDCLYGRYWGADGYHQNLHFELCYYQGMDFCMQRGLKRFEAGAQGTHKVSRGFRPVRTWSAHKLKHKDFHRAISGFIVQEKRDVELQISQLEQQLPFK